MEEAAGNLIYLDCRFFTLNANMFLRQDDDGELLNEPDHWGYNYWETRARNIGM